VLRDGRLQGSGGGLQDVACSSMADGRSRRAAGRGGEAAREWQQCSRGCGLLFRACKQKIDRLATRLVNTTLSVYKYKMFSFVKQIYLDIFSVCRFTQIYTLKLI
jgi:hypothetical protein